jgi:hypothetical protein
MRLEYSTETDQAVRTRLELAQLSFEGLRIDLDALKGALASARSEWVGAATPAELAELQRWEAHVPLLERRLEPPKRALHRLERDLEQAG